MYNLKLISLFQTLSSSRSFNAGTEGAVSSSFMSQTEMGPMHSFM